MIEPTADLLELTTLVVVSHVEHNCVHAGDVPDLIKAVHGAFSNLGKPVEQAAPTKDKPTGAIGLRKSLADPAKIISKIDGSPTLHSNVTSASTAITPESYREAFGLPRDYKMVAAAYSEMRSTMSKAMGLGRKRAEKVVEKVEEVAAPAAKAGKAVAQRGRKQASV